MPENGIGLFPDVGASYFLTHYVPKSIGLYISLTGCILSGEDCFYSGLCNYFILEVDFEKFLKECTYEDPEIVIQRYHKTPNSSKNHLENSKIIKHQSTIEECFGNCNSIEEICIKLQNNQSK